LSEPNQRRARRPLVHHRRVVEAGRNCRGRAQRLGGLITHDLVPLLVKAGALAADRQHADWRGCRVHGHRFLSRVASH
jgi:hypothetical protein